MLQYSFGLLDLVFLSLLCSFLLYTCLFLLINFLYDLFSCLRASSFWVGFILFSLFFFPEMLFTFQVALVVKPRFILIFWSRGIVALSGLFRNACFKPCFSGDIY